MENEEIREEECFNLSSLSNEEVIEFYNNVDNHIKFLKNNILEVEEEEE